jgi:hypothetical protein
MDEDMKYKLRKNEIMTYLRRNKVLVPPPQATKKGVPPPPLASKEISPPPPPSVHDFLPPPVPSIEELHLNIDVPDMMGNMNMSIPMVEMCKIPSVRREVLKALRVQDEAGYSPVILNTMHHGGHGEDNPSFYLSLGINGFFLNNFMLDSRASEM